MIQINTKKNETYVEIDSKCATFNISYTQGQHFQFSDLTKLENVSQTKAPRKFTELVP